MPALHNGLTSNPKLQEAFRRILGEQSQFFAGLERASESLQPVIDMWSMPEWALLRGEIIFSQTTSIAANAGTFQSQEFVNAAGSGVIAVMLEIRNLSNDVRVCVDAGTALGVVATTRGIANDSRFLSGEVSRCTIVTGQLVAGSALTQEFLGTSVVSTHPYIIAPGDKLTIINNAVNNGVITNLLWTERQILGTEGSV